MPAIPFSPIFLFPVWLNITLRRRIGHKYYSFIVWLLRAVVSTEVTTYGGIEIRILLLLSLLLMMLHVYRHLLQLKRQPRDTFSVPT